MKIGNVMDSVKERVLSLAHSWKSRLPFGQKSGGDSPYGGREDDGREYDDRGYDDRGYDGRGYDDRGYDDRGYDDRGYDDRGYDDRGYDGQGYDDYDSDYGRDRYNGREFDPPDENIVLRYLYDTEWLTWVLLVVLPPLGIWLLWKRDRFDIMIRAIISAVSAIWFIIALVLIFSGIGGSDDPTTPGANTGGTISLISPSAAAPSASSAEPGASGTPILNATPSPTPSASASASTNSGTTGGSSTPRPGNSNTGTSTTTDPNANATVFANATGMWYHRQSTCPQSGMTTAGTPMTVASAEQQGKTACPYCIGGTSNNGTDTNATYYYHDDSTYYHSNSTCDGRMSEAPAHSYTETMASGKDPCPNCIGLWATETGKYYHTNPNCDGMTGARLYTKSEAEKLNDVHPHTLCPICAGGTVVGTITSLTDTVYMTETGEWFHTQSNCQNMKGAKAFTAEEARYLYDRDPCPRCVKIDFSGVTVETNPSKVLSSNSSVVWATRGEPYYHIDENCSQFRNSGNKVMATAKFCLEQNMAPCPLCITGATAPSPTYNPDPSVEDVYSPESVRWYSSTSDRYFHVDSDCENATGRLASATPSVIYSRDQAPCPLCIGVKTTDNVYARSDEPYYHTDRNCSRANNCYNVSLFRALANGKKPCPDCILAANNPSGQQPTPPPGSSSDEYVYLDMEGVYHARSSCGAVASSTRRWSLSEAIDRFEPCSVCNPPTELGGNDNDNGNDSDGTTYVYIATETIAHNGYYHRRSSCSDAGMTSDNSQRVTLDWALRFDYEPCPRCNPPTE